ncbi:MAG: TonB family protein, partial [Gammaproteobacteria bacterium]|nr:TonB family protein [Gammaproteobacteria bacterium]
DDTPIAKLGSKAKISGKGSKAKKTTRSLVTSNAGSSSAGINTAALSRNTGGSGDSMGGVEFSRVESSIGSDFFGEEAPLSSGPGPSRTDEEIQIVFDKYKSALYRIYNRELRKNPMLQGKMVLRLTIEPDGKVSACSVDSSDMDAPALDKKIAARVKKFNFGAKDGVPTITILYPIDFLPAS